MLQNHIFPTIPGYLGKNGHARGLLDEKMIRDFKKTAFSVRFLSRESVNNNTNQFINSILSRCRTAQSPDYLVLSEEGLCAWPTTNSEYGKWPVGSRVDAELCRKRPMPFTQFLGENLLPEWKKYGDIQVVLTLRNQADYLASLYAQKSQYRRGACQEDFERQVNELLAADDPSIDWSAVAQDLDNVVGRDNVTILLFEDIGHPRFWDNLCHTFGVEAFAPETFSGESTPKENRKGKGSSTWQISPSRDAMPSNILATYWPQKWPGKQMVVEGARRAFDPTLGSFCQSLLEKKRGKEFFVTDNMRERIREHFSESNRVLAERINRDLKELGY